MNVVEIAANATSPFRRRPEVVSRNRYSNRDTSCTPLAPGRG